MRFPPAASGARFVPTGGGVTVVGHGLQRSVALKSYDSVDVDHLDGDGVVKAPMHGKVLAILVEQGARVTKGERVEKGQVIAYAGATGDVSEPQLHFELRHGVTPVDPRPYLATYGL